MGPKCRQGTPSLPQAGSHSTKRTRNYAIKQSTCLASYHCCLLQGRHRQSKATNATVETIVTCAATLILSKLVLGIRYPTFKLHISLCSCIILHKGFCTGASGHIGLKHPLRLRVLLQNEGNEVYRAVHAAVAGRCRGSEVTVKLQTLSCTLQCHGRGDRACLYNVCQFFIVDNYLSARHGVL